MTLPADLFATDRARAPHAGSEFELLQGWLDFHRDTLARNCAGLDADQLRQRSCEPSTLTLHGIVRHLAEVEAWFNDDVSDAPVAPLARSTRTGAEISLRWIYLHLIEEYARHNGPADLLREAIDGATGD